MSKPEEVSIDAWTRAQMALDRDPGEREEAIARAIMAAEKRGEERERAACALLAKEYSAEHASIAVDALDLRRPLDMATATKASMVANQIMDAILHRGGGPNA